MRSTFLFQPGPLTHSTWCAGGVLNNSSGSTSFHNGACTISLLGGSITNSAAAGTTFKFTLTPISGYGSVSGVTDMVATVTAAGGTVAMPQTLFFNGSFGAGTNLGSAAGTGITMTTAGSNNTLDLQGKLNLINPFALSPNNGAVNLDGVTIANAGNWNDTWNAGSINVTNSSVLAGPVTSAALLTLINGTSLTATGATFTNNGTVVVNHALATWGSFTDNGIYESEPSTQTFLNLTVGTAGYMTGGAGEFSRSRRT